MRFIFAYFLLASVASATPGEIELRFTTANSVREIASALQSKIIPSEIKSMLLDSSRVEDKDFARKVVLEWKGLSDTNAFTEFDELVINDDEGSEQLRMKPTSSLNQTMPVFQINGRAWVVPENGSISNSLRKHLDDSATFARFSPPRLLRLLIPEAIATSGDQTRKASETALAPAFVFVEKILTASEALKLNHAGNYVVSDSAWFDSLKRLINVNIQCRGAIATGSVKIIRERMKFEARPDGSVIFTLDDSEGTKLLASARKVDQRRIAKSALELLDRKPRTEDISRDIFQAFFKMEKITHGDATYKVTWNALNEATRTSISQTRKFGPSVAANEGLLRAFYESRNRIIVTDEVAAAKCATPECNASEAVNFHGTIQPWLKRDDQDHILLAERWTPKNSPKGSAKIVVTDEFQHPIYSLQQKTKSLSKVDFADGERLAADATRAAKRSSNGVRNVMLSLRPLGACCADSECRKQLKDQGIDLVPNKSETTGK